MKRLVLIVAHDEHKSPDSGGDARETSVDVADHASESARLRRLMRLSYHRVDLTDKTCYFPGK